MMIRRALRVPLLLAFPLAMIVGACSENLESGGTCPALCPGQQLDIRDTLIDPAIVFDTTLQRFPLLGFEPSLLLAARGDSLDVRAIVRFDTLIRGFRPAEGDTVRAVTMVDSVSLNIRLLRTRLALPERFTIEAYDVADTLLVDSLPQNLAPFFVPERLLGFVHVDSTGLRDTTTIKIPIDSVRLLDTIEQVGAVFRIGLRIVSSDPVEVLVRSADDGNFAPRLRYRVSPDTSVSVALVAPSSAYPRKPVTPLLDFADYSFVVVAPSFRAGALLGVGALPASRSYLRFDLPIWLTDSSAILRARLELVQNPVYGLNETDTIAVLAQMVLAGHEVTDLRRAVDLLAPEGFFILDSLRIAPADSGSRFLELNQLVRQWRSVDGVRPIPSALILKSRDEGMTATGVRFFGVLADPSLRPRLRVSYVPAFPFGQP